MSVDVRAIIEEHADFVWRVLVRAGVREADLKDASQEVFIVVANKHHQFDLGTKMTTWLYGIAVRVAANHRRKARRKCEDLTDLAIEPKDRVQTTPEDAMVREQARLELANSLDRLPVEQRIVFELFELEEMTCPQIAESLGIPLGTTYTRLRSARASLRVAFAAKEASDDA